MKNKVVDLIFKLMDEEGKEAIDDFYRKNVDKEYKQLSDVELMTIDDQEIDEETKDSIREYSGYNSKNMNNTLRSSWNYEENGDISSLMKAKMTVHRINSYIRNNQKSMGNIQVFRGVNLTYFSDYGIHSLEELNDLDFIADSGLVSTSLIEENCFFNNDNDIRKNYNIEIRYMVPEEFGDGIYLSGDLSYTPGHNEYLLNSSNIAKVANVEVEDDKAKIDALLIPKQVYNKAYMVEERRVK